VVAPLHQGETSTEERDGEAERAQAPGGLELADQDADQPELDQNVTDV
jgi:hypothetical protein